MGFDSGMAADAAACWTANAQAAGATATATKAAVSGSRHFVYGFTASGDKAGALWQLKDGSTVVAQGKILADDTVVMVSPDKDCPLLAGTLSGAVSLVVSGATSYSTAALFGRSFPMGQ